MTGWLPWVSTGVPLVGLGLAWVNVRITSAKWHQDNKPTLQVGPHWMNKRIPHITVGHEGPPLARIELQVLRPRAGTQRAGLLMGTGRGEPVDSYTVPGPIQQGAQQVIRVALDAAPRGDKMLLRVTSYPERTTVWWRRWLHQDRASWEDLVTVTFPRPARISTATFDRLPSQADVRRRREG